MLKRQKLYRSHHDLPNIEKLFFDGTVIDFFER